MQEGFTHIKERVPFTIKELHPDNGPEFFNDHMVRFWGEELTGLRLSRSRSYHKNDNRWVEQKNDTLVRAYLGDGRLDTHKQVEALNELYELMWVYYNLFQPVLHISGKQYLQEEGRMRRKWDTARTPYERVKQSGALSEEGRGKGQVRRTVHKDQSEGATHRNLQVFGAPLEMAGSG